jgi:hypothetical protein
MQPSPLRVLVLLISIVASGGRASAQPTAQLEVTARQSFEQGEHLVAQGRYVEGLAAFAAGYELSKRPLFLFNMGESARLAGQPERATDYYARYLQADATGKYASLARERLQALGAAPEPNPPSNASSTIPSVTLPSPKEAARRVVAADRAVPPLPTDRDLPPPRTPLHRRWQLWVGVGIVVVGATVFAISQRGQDSCRDCVDLR